MTMSIAEKTYQEKSAKGLALFRALLEKSAGRSYDDAYLALLTDYQELFPFSENVSIFYARYALAHDAVKVALETLETAQKYKKCHYEIWQLLIECYKRLDDTRNLIIFEGISSRVYRTPIEVSFPKDHLDDALALLSLAMGVPVYAPYTIGRARLEDGAIKAPPGSFVGEFLPTFSKEPAKYRYFSGIFAELIEIDAKAALFEEVKEKPEVAARAETFLFDIMKAKAAKKKALLDPRQDACDKSDVHDIAVALAGTEEGQKVSFKSDLLGEASIHLGKWVYSFFRLQERTEIESAAPFMISEPVRLRHSKKRKKLILHILVDALCWPAMKRCDFSLMPNLMRFFSKGIIFNDNFSVAEYTYPSLATIETGLYSHHSQIFNSTCMAELEPSFLTLSEQMKRLGYYCVNVFGDACGIYNGVTRGYDRLLVQSGGTGLRAYQGVEYALSNLRAFAQTDLFMFMHVQDTHPSTSSKWQVPLETQVLLATQDRLDDAEEGTPSVDRTRSRLHLEAIREGMRRVDLSLGRLFSYLEENYAEDEYIVQLYSDHGAIIFGNEVDYVNENITGAAWMLRGAGVAQMGVVEELTSVLDIYPTAAHLVGFDAPLDLDGSLPRVFGGKGRDHTVSYTMFPGKPFNLALRTKTHEFFLGSKEIVDEDGSVDLREPKQSLFLRDKTHQEVKDQKLRQSFLDLARSYMASFDTRGENWPKKRALRKPWYDVAGKEEES